MTKRTAAAAGLTAPPRASKRNKPNAELQQLGGGNAVLNQRTGAVIKAAPEKKKRPERQVLTSAGAGDGNVRPAPQRAAHFSEVSLERAAPTPRASSIPAANKVVVDVAPFPEHRPVQQAVPGVEIDARAGRASSVPAVDTANDATNTPAKHHFIGPAARLERVQNASNKVIAAQTFLIMTFQRVRAMERHMEHLRSEVSGKKAQAQEMIDPDSPLPEAWEAGGHLLASCLGAANRLDHSFRADSVLLQQKVDQAEAEVTRMTENKRRCDVDLATKAATPTPLDGDPLDYATEFETLIDGLGRATMGYETEREAAETTLDQLTAWMALNRTRMNKLSRNDRIHERAVVDGGLGNDFLVKFNRDIKRTWQAPNTSLNKAETLLRQVLKEHRELLANKAPAHVAMSARITLDSWAKQAQSAGYQTFAFQLSMRGEIKAIEAIEENFEFNEDFIQQAHDLRDAEASLAGIQDGDVSTADIYNSCQAYQHRIHVRADTLAERQKTLDALPDKYKKGAPWEAWVLEKDLQDDDDEARECQWDSDLSRLGYAVEQAKAELKEAQTEAMSQGYRIRPDGRLKLYLRPCPWAGGGKGKDGFWEDGFWEAEEASQHFLTDERIGKYTWRHARYRLWQAKIFVERLQGHAGLGNRGGRKSLRSVVESLKSVDADENDSHRDPLHWGVTDSQQAFKEHLRRTVGKGPLKTELHPRVLKKLPDCNCFICVEDTFDYEDGPEDESLADPSRSQ